MLSDRLKMVADCVMKCNMAADIGTDHGYIPIWLIKNSIADKAIAADISSGSCQKALHNITLNKLNNRIDVRCGNGLKVIDGNKENIDCIIISGMGGLLMVDVLKSNIKVFQNSSQLVLQPQRDIYEVRKYIINNGFKIIDEKFLKEKDKFYICVNAVKGKSDYYTEKELFFGKFIPNNKSADYKEYITIELNKLNNAINSLKNNLSNDNKIRFNELVNNYNMYSEVLKCL